MKGVLNGCKVLVTRPHDQGEKLCRLVQDDGGIAIPFPTLELTLTRELNRGDLLQLLVVASHIVFVSRSAVVFADQIAGDLAMNMRGKLVIAVGEGTRRELAAHDVYQVISPGPQSGSEQLLDLPELEASRVRGQYILIVCGNDGRDLLQQTLQARGAKVSCAQVYRRSEPAGARAKVASIWHRDCPDVIVATSKQGLLNLIRMTADQDRGIMLGKRLVVMSPRIADAAVEAGFVTPAIVATEQSDQGLLQAIRQTVE
jgi:uroporphyrinogen-III synthase